MSISESVRGLIRRRNSSCLQDFSFSATSLRLASKESQTLMESLPKLRGFVVRQESRLNNLLFGFSGEQETLQGVLHVFCKNSSRSEREGRRQSISEAGRRSRQSSRKGRFLALATAVREIWTRWLNFWSRGWDVKKRLT